MKPKLLFLVTEDWYFCSHRLPIARAARDAGYEVLVATRVDRHGGLIEREGFRLFPISLRRSNKNPVRELLAFLELVQLYRRERPALVHHVAFKPVILGSLAARLTGAPCVVNAVAGLGFAFIGAGVKAGILRRLVCLAYRAVLSAKNAKALFQNEEDRAAFISMGLVPPERTAVIRGSGVDLSLFKPSPTPKGDTVVVLAGRMLWDKGVGEFVAAAEKLRAQGVKARFVLLGNSDPDNLAAVPLEQLEKWKANGAVEWWGFRSDMPEVLAQAHIACLPSYREGLPKFLIEAAASARPIIAADVPGCREIVRDGENGLLVPARNADALAAALRALIENPERAEHLGARGRKMAEAEFSQECVVQQTLSLYARLAGGRPA